MPKEALLEAEAEASGRLDVFYGFGPFAWIWGARFYSYPFHSFSGQYVLIMI